MITKTRIMNQKPPGVRVVSGWSNGVSMDLVYQTPSLPPPLLPSPPLPSRQMSNSNQLQMCCLIISEAVFTPFTWYRAGVTHTLSLMSPGHQYNAMMYLHTFCDQWLYILLVATVRIARPAGHCCWPLWGMNRTLLPCVTRDQGGWDAACDQDRGSDVKFDR